jgi:hypothetical protein
VNWFGNRFTTHVGKEEVDMATTMNLDTVPSIRPSERKVAGEVIALYLDPYVPIEQIANTCGITKDTVFQIVHKARKHYGSSVIPRVGIRAGHPRGVPIGTQVGQRYDSPHPSGKRSGDAHVPEVEVEVPEVEVDAAPAAPPVAKKKGVPALLAELDERADLVIAAAFDTKNLVSELKSRLTPLFDE